MIEADKASYRITRMCELLEVALGYYNWRARGDGGPAPAQRWRAELDAQVAALHAASYGVYRTTNVRSMQIWEIAGSPVNR